MWFAPLVKLSHFDGLLDAPIQRRRPPYESYDRAARWLCGSNHSLVDFVQKLVQCSPAAALAESFKELMRVVLRPQ